MSLTLSIVIASILPAQAEAQKRLLDEYRRSLGELKAHYHTLTMHWRQVERPFPRSAERHQLVKSHHSKGMFRGETRWTKEEGKIPAGSTRHDVATRETWFEVTESPGTGLRLTSHRPMGSDQITNIINNYPVSVAPFALWERSIDSLLTSDEVLVRSFAPWPAGGQSIYKLDLVWKDGIRTATLYVDRQRKWALRTYEIQLRPQGAATPTGIYRAVIDYTERNGFPVPTRFERWIDHVKSGEKRSWMIADQIVVEQNEVPESFFALDDFGIEPPGSAETRSFPWFWFFLVVACGSGALLVIRRMRRRASD